VCAASFRAFIRDSGKKDSIVKSLSDFMLPP
jgi:hypothetical protein